jgi:hypothetical protein
METLTAPPTVAPTPPRQAETVESAPDVTARLRDIDSGISRVRSIRDHGRPTMVAGYDDAIALLEAERDTLLGTEPLPAVVPVEAMPPGEAFAEVADPATGASEVLVTAAPPAVAPSPAEVPDTTPRQAAEAAEAAARAEHAAWGQRINGQRERGRQVNTELGEIAEQLTAARMAALRGEAASSEELVTRQRELEAERDELEARVTVGQAEQGRVRQTLEAAAAEALTLRILDEQVTRVARSEQLYPEIGEAYSRLVLLLNEFADIAEGSRRLARLGTVPVGEIPFSWGRVLVAPGLQRSRIPFPGTW